MSRKTPHALLSFLLALRTCTAQPPDEYNIPERLRKDITQTEFASQFAIDARVNPFYLRGDFDGDGQPDYAFVIVSQKQRKRGIAVWLSSRPKSRWQILGAGRPAFRQSYDDLDFDTWQVYGKRVVHQGASAAKPPRLVAEAILTEWDSSASGLIYWTGKTFAWYQQGD